MTHTNANGNSYQIQRVKHGTYQVYRVVPDKSGERFQHVGYSSSERGAKVLASHFDPKQFSCPSYCASWDQRKCDCSKGYVV